MKLRAFVLALLLLGASSTATRAAHDIVIDVRPPPPRVLAFPVERPGYVWAPGYWRWSGHHHVWVDGRWLHARHGYHWVAAHWEGRHGRFHFVEGHWAR